MTRKPRLFSVDAADGEKAVLLAVKTKAPKGSECYDFDESVNELKALVEAAGAVAKEVFTQSLVHPHPKFYLGKGKLNEVAAWIEDNSVSMCVVDDELSPTQHKTLSQVLNIKVIDRTHLILDIFASRAHSHLGKLQVELAQLKYLFPRLVGMWTHFEKQEGAIGTRGPGETQLETDKRLLRKRILFLEKQLEKVAGQHQEQRKSRQKAFQPIFSLVGYTNAGKTSLLNFLTGQELKEDDAVFTTLDSTTRKVRLKSSNEVIISDTVGFIQRIPHSLISSFRTTLEEVKLADCLVHVIDVTDPVREEKMNTVKETLAEIIGKESKIPMLYVFNKTDRWVDQEEKFSLSSFHSPTVFISCKKREGREELLEAIEKMVKNTQQEFSFFIPFTKERLVHEIYQKGVVLHNQREDDGTKITAYVGEKLFSQLKEFATER